MATTNDKLDYLRSETDDLQARVVGLSAVIGALVATHPDKAAFHEHLMKLRGTLADNPPEPLESQEQLNSALEMINWIDRDLPAAR